MHQTNNGCILIYLSSILRKLVHSSLASEWKLTYLHEKKLLDTVGSLLVRSIATDEVLLGNYGQLFYGEGEGQLYGDGEGDGGMYCHVQVFSNCVQILNLVSCDCEGSSYLKKRELYTKVHIGGCRNSGAT